MNSCVRLSIQRFINGIPWWRLRYDANHNLRGVQVDCLQSYKDFLSRCDFVSVPHPHYVMCFAYKIVVSIHMWSWIYLQIFLFNDECRSIFDLGMHVVVLISDRNMKVFISKTHFFTPLVCTGPVNEHEVCFVLAVLYDPKTHICPVVRNFLNSRISLHLYRLKIR